MQKAKPTLFSTPMVQAILRGVDPKTMTRRVIKLPNWMEWDENQRITMRCEDSAYADQDPVHLFEQGYLECPYGKPGDILWVRETWGNYSYDDTESNAVYFMYRADYPDDAQGYWYEKEQINWCDFPRWRSSRYMPKAAARIFLRVKSVRVERLQDIKFWDAQKEGCPRCIGISECGGGCEVCESNNPIEWFRQLWNSINADRGFGWDTNPWVWAITFERCDKPAGWPGRG